MKPKTDDDLNKSSKHVIELSITNAENIGFLKHFKPHPFGRTEVKNEKEEEDITRGLGTEADPITLTSDEEVEPSVSRVRSFLNSKRRKKCSSTAKDDPILSKLRCTMPRHGGPGAVTFTVRDIERLGPEEFLNDTAIDFYLKYLEVMLLEENPEAAKRCYIFNSFFFKKLSDKNGMLIHGILVING